MFFGLWFVLIGSIWLCQELGYIKSDLKLYWPATLIVFGAYCIVQSYRNRKFFRWVRKKVEIDS